MKLSVSAFRAHASAHKKILNTSSYHNTHHYGSTASSSLAVQSPAFLQLQVVLSSVVLYSIFSPKCEEGTARRPSRCSTCDRTVDHHTPMFSALTQLKLEDSDTSSLILSKCGYIVFTLFKTRSFV
ncbi:hypothetical protein J6590_083729 [Homalodisca vitripennis]|nr:hypothetical protein J6590_083729 [Homalodisca vitripennis]